jgi:hypothetical protein
MNNNKSKLSILIESLVSEELSIDEPKGGTLGKVAFGPERSDAPKEPNTPVEDEMFQALDQHFFDNESEDLEKFAPKLISLATSNKYSKVLKPNPGIAYRILSYVSLKLGSKILGITVKDILQQSNKAVYVPSTVKVNSPVQKIQSWTMVPEVERFSSLDGSYGAPNEDDGRLYILMKANVPSSGKFFLNSNAVEVMPILPNENEVISYGPVKLSGASFYYVAGNHKKSSNKSIIQALINSVIAGS